MMITIHILSLIWILLWQVTAQAVTPEKSWLQLTLEYISMIGTPLAVIGVLVALVYFFWHGKNREELTKTVAELKELCDTRAKKISDQKEEIADHLLTISKRDAALSEKLREIADLELEILAAEELDEKRAKTEFRLRGQINDLEKRLGLDIHETGA